MNYPKNVPGIFQELGELLELGYLIIFHTSIDLFVMMYSTSKNFPRKVNIDPFVLV